jgi:hypothetical protein
LRANRLLRPYHRHPCAEGREVGLHAVGPTGVAPIRQGGVEQNEIIRPSGVNRVSARGNGGPRGVGDVDVHVETREAHADVLPLFERRQHEEACPLDPGRARRPLGGLAVQPRERLALGRPFALALGHDGRQRPLSRPEAKDVERPRGGAARGETERPPEQRPGRGNGEDRQSCHGLAGCVMAWLAAGAGR